MIILDEEHDPSFKQDQPAPATTPAPSPTGDRTSTNAP
jgi:hypothetical protein